MHATCKPSNTYSNNLIWDGYCTFSALRFSHGHITGHYRECTHWCVHRVHMPFPARLLSNSCVNIQCVYNNWMHNLNSIFIQILFPISKVNMHSFFFTNRNVYVQAFLIVCTEAENMQAVYFSSDIMATSCVGRFTRSVHS